MNENIFKENTNLENKSKFTEFYNKNKLIIFSFLSIVIVFLILLNFYFGNKKKEQLRLSENYISAKIYIENGENEKAIKILKNIIESKNDTYSTLALFLLLDKEFLQDKKEALDLFDYILKNTKFDKDIKNLIIYKKSIFHSNFFKEDQLLESLKPLLNDDTVWKPHALLLLGDFYLFRGQKSKAREFYSEILSLKNIDKEFYKKASMQIVFTNDN